ncbi:hypothetical protein WR25_14947 [Diploscapter pachys]|uniref:Protein kinase domain-containing protein n=1 Tax=Diploscapter pachys TaxID=2018661 RepID=A0A2A2LS47_9BILA|nr:hypothetical protein WR25_14947 [Diploscapter pachys]
MTSSASSTEDDSLTASSDTSPLSSIDSDCSASFTFDPNNNSNADGNTALFCKLQISDEKHQEVSRNSLQTVVTIGTGTFGRVELVKHEKTGLHYALKILNIHRVVQTRQVDHVYSEKKILEQLDHPFIVNLFTTDQDERNLYIIMEFLPGGELFSYLRESRVFSNSTSRFYAAEIVSALDYLHAHGIAYRDLKPENLMLTKDGHIKMVDFGFAKKLRDRSYTMCGTPEYLAPESLSNKGHNKAVDWWSLGILIYEMMVGRPPFRGKTTSEIYDAIVEHKLKFTRSFNLVAKDLVKKLLVVDRTMRLGCMKNGSLDVIEHRWFEKINWDDLTNLRIKPPIIPTLYHAGDHGNFDFYNEPVEPGQIAPQRERDLFREW